jgi:glyoxylase-like metal-dependent hydrolase (beta-lactamase superfamily II)
MRKPPGTEEVRPGLWSISVPIPHNPLGYTLVYLLESDRGPVLVDAGWDDPTSWTALVQGVATTDHHIGDCYGVLVTHHHPDHHGLSGRVREVSGAWIAMHAEDAQIVTTRRESQDDWLARTGAVLLAAGASETDLADLPPPGEGGESIPATPNRLLADGELADVPGHRMRVVWTPGHTPGHICLHDESADVLLTGDHVLPKITPHIGLYNVDSPDDPLGDYLRSLERLRGYSPREVLPAHLHRFANLPPRLQELIDHHQERLDGIVAMLQEGPATAWEITARMEWNRPWEEFGPMMKRAALGEGLAHIRCLEQLGRVRIDGTAEPATYELVA